jgi:tRNA threonylcarbamoyladenosine biosynthesis protein TsaB
MRTSWLILETSGRGGVVAVAVEGVVAATGSLDAGRRHNRDLIPMAASFLNQQEIQPRELTGIMVGIGPGSFTGLRVGLITAKTLAYALGCALIPVPTFQAIASQIPDDLPRVDVISDALQGLVYAQQFGPRDERGIRWPLSALRIQKLDVWVDALESDTIVAGPALGLFDARIPSTVRRAETADCHPSATGIFRVGQGLPPASTEEMLRLEPLYLRGSSAEEKAARSPT